MSQIHQNPVSIERRLKSWNIEYNFKWNHPYLSRVSNLSRGLNSLNSASRIVTRHLVVYTIYAPKENSDSLKSENLSFKGHWDAEGIETVEIGINFLKKRKFWEQTICFLNNGVVQKKNERWTKDFELSEKKNINRLNNLDR